MKRIYPLLLGLLVIGCGVSNTNGIPPVTEAVAETKAAATHTPTGADSSQPTENVADDTPTPADNPAEPTEETDTTDETAIADPNPTERLNQVLFTQTGGAEALAQIRESNDTRFVAGLIDALRYRRDLGDDIGFTLNTLTGQNLDADWFEWVEWAGNHLDIESFEEYVDWKADLFAQIDPNFLRFVNTDIKIDPNSRVEEIVWGGVRVDGIPALDNPTMIDPEEADYLIPDERVFGVSINGDTRAYPARFLDWHEMFNDVVGGEPVSLAY